MKKIMIVMKANNNNSQEFLSLLPGLKCLASQYGYQLLDHTFNEKEWITLRAQAKKFDYHKWKFQKSSEISCVSEESMKGHKQMTILFKIPTQFNPVSSNYYLVTLIMNSNLSEILIGDLSVFGMSAQGGSVILVDTLGIVCCGINKKLRLTWDVSFIQNLSTSNFWVMITEEEKGIGKIEDLGLSNMKFMLSHKVHNLGTIVCHKDLRYLWRLFKLDIANKSTDEIKNFYLNIFAFGLRLLKAEIKEEWITEFNKSLSLDKNNEKSTNSCELYGLT
jgi:hypothetical protein